MPKLIASSGLQTRKIGGSNFTFQAARIGDLGATEYTLVTVAVDVTWSVKSFATELRQMLVAAIEACQRSPRSDNLLLRVLLFSTSIPGGIEELHGFKPLSDVDPTAYPVFTPDGGTPLFDAAFSAIGATVDYGEELADNDFLANGIVIVITDGENNSSTATTTMIRRQLEETQRQEKLESLLTILVGINAARFQYELDLFKREAGLDHYLDAGSATPSKLAKLAAFVSQSVSSQSQSLGTGGASQTISATI